MSELSSSVALPQLLYCFLPAPEVLQGDPGVQVGFAEAGIVGRLPGSLAEASERLEPAFLASEDNTPAYVHRFRRGAGGETLPVHLDRLLVLLLLLVGIAPALEQIDVAGLPLQSAAEGGDRLFVTLLPGQGLTPEKVEIDAVRHRLDGFAQKLVDAVVLLELQVIARRVEPGLDPVGLQADDALESIRRELIPLNGCQGSAQPVQEPGIRPVESGQVLRTVEQARELRHDHRAFGKMMRGGD